MPTSADCYLYLQISQLILWKIRDITRGISISFFKYSLKYCSCRIIIAYFISKWISARLFKLRTGVAIYNKRNSDLYDTNQCCYRPNFPCFSFFPAVLTLYRTLSDVCNYHRRERKISYKVCFFLIRHCFRKSLDYTFNWKV